MKNIRIVLVLWTALNVISCASVREILDSETIITAAAVKINAAGIAQQYARDMVEFGGQEALEAVQPELNALLLLDDKARAMTTGDAVNTLLGASQIAADIWVNITVLRDAMIHARKVAQGEKNIKLIEWYEQALFLKNRFDEAEDLIESNARLVEFATVAKLVATVAL